MAVYVLLGVVVLMLGLQLYQQRRPTRTTAPPERGHTDAYVRRLDYDADIAALRRANTDLNEAMEARFKTLSGMISRGRRGAVLEERDELAAAAADALAARRNGVEARSAEGEGHMSRRRRLQPVRSA